MATPQPQPQYQQRHSYAGPFNASSNYGHEDDSPFGPLTTQLPVETQQILAGGMFPSYGDQDSTWAQDFQQPFYSYNPNSKPKMGKGLQATSGGLNQTLMPTSLDTSFGGNGNGLFYDSPLSGNDGLDSAVSNPGFGLGYDNNFFGFDLFAGATSSGQRTPADNEFMSQYVDGNMFAA